VGNERTDLHLNKDVFDEIDLGPQSESDNPFTAKARKLQSLWRAENGLEIGVGPGKNANKKGIPTKYGSMIADGEVDGKNFYFPETFEYAKWRVDTKLKDETINAYRLFNNLLSSMPMAFNLFHPLMMLKAEKPALVDLMIKSAFPTIPSIYRVQEIGLEFIPTPKEIYTHDKSAMDAFIRYQDREGNNYLIAIETKYTDSLGTNTASDKAQKYQLEVMRELNIFTPEFINSINESKIKICQIFRNFILAEQYGKIHGLKRVYSVVMSPEDHPTTQNEIKSLQIRLNEEATKRVFALSFEEFSTAIRVHCSGKYRMWIDWFHDRYLNFERV
ncbi:MAG: hypothetical protein PHS04_15665, partial [Tissierellia bacterium]|nr:hypothetical protein [Tissierellia bacterium]